MRRLDLSIDQKFNVALINKTQNKLFLENGSSYEIFVQDIKHRSESDPQLLYDTPFNIVSF
jgi:hypothetical protein